MNKNSAVVWFFFFVKLCVVILTKKQILFWQTICDEWRNENCVAFFFLVTESKKKQIRL